MYNIIYKNLRKSSTDNEIFKVKIKNRFHFINYYDNGFNNAFSMV